MANILFTWELGAGSGHIAPYVNLVKQLEQDGHNIFYTLKYLNHCQQYFKDTNVTFFQSPGEYRPVINKAKNSNSFAKILHNAGFGDAEFLTTLIKSWQNLYKMVNPDLIIFDYSPTALLAAQGYDAKRLAIGTGFHLPPEISPIPSIWTELGTSKKDDTEEVKSFEKQMLEYINHAAKQTGIKPLTNFYELYNADKKIYRTYKEIDHYQTRVNGTYSGVLKSPAGVKPVWPELPGPKIFAYLKPFKTLPKLLEVIKKRKLPTLIYGDGLSAKLVKEFSSDSLRFSDDRLDMETIGKTADVAICNSGHSASCELLLSGVPILLLPLNLEQHMVAKNIHNLGAGLCAPKLVPEGMTTKLKALVKESKYRENARKFAEKYASNNDGSLVDEISNTIRTLLK